MTRLVRRVFSAFWQLAGAVNIRVKILGIVLGLVLLMGAVATLQVRATLTQAMNTQFQDQAVSVAHDIAARSTDLILINDLYGLHQLLSDTLENNTNVRYAFVMSENGRVLAHTFGDGFPPGLLDMNRVAPDQHHATIIVDTTEGRMWDTAVPIFDGKAGTARLGLSDASLRRTLDTLTGQLLLTTVLVAVIGVSAAATLTWVLTHPILQLVQVAQSVERGDYSKRLTRWADDEIGALTMAFNRMSDALQVAHLERVEREQLRAEYVSRIIHAQEEERKRIARELHDSTSQSLTSLMIGLKALGTTPEQEEIVRRAEELRAVAGDTLENVHSLALQLRPSVLDDLGLPEALRRHVADCRKRHHLDIDIAITGLESCRLPPDIETALYRITQEALTNIVRHAQAATASIFIERTEHQVRAIIDDDGIGFDPASVLPNEGHLGLYGIRERAELLSGRLTIESDPGRGTSLFVEIPLQGA
jgi:signal transduction histidine kinase